MLTHEERALLTERQDRLIELLVQHDEAVRAEDWTRARELQVRVDDLREETNAIRRWDTAGRC